MKPDLTLAPDSEAEYVEVYFDVCSKTYGIRQIKTAINSGVYVNTEKCMEMTIQQFKDFLNSANNFIGIEKTYA